MLVVVNLVFFSLVSGISSLSNMVKLGSIATKTIGLYLLTTAIAVSLALFFGWALDLCWKLRRGSSLHTTILAILAYMELFLEYFLTICTGLL
jgi:Na+/H+-dicarboxylate symporters